VVRRVQRRRLPRSFSMAVSSWLLRGALLGAAGGGRGRRVNRSGVLEDDPALHLLTGENGLVVPSNEDAQVSGPVGERHR